MPQNTQKSNQGWTRRQFLTSIGMAGGAVALYETMTALGMLNKPTAWAGPPRVSQAQGVGESVLILGAGIGGLTAAYLLSQSGYRVGNLRSHLAGWWAQLQRPSWRCGDRSQRRARYHPPGVSVR
ncbi:NAD(P)-binding protein [Chloroflexi bacterium TSY]|nr:NAD(P)-binding protein [Chloroflexi bacterium TSY]